MAGKKEGIVVKKIKKGGGHGHHGGAWKVAYADFVTAMMAFFLLLWLLTATPVENLKGLADYFTPTMGLQGKMGVGFRGGAAPNTEGVSSGDWAAQGLVFGSPPSGPILKMPEQDNKIEEDNEKVTFNRVEDTVQKTLEENKEFGQFKENILIEQTPEGLNIHITDRKDRPMFRPGTADIQEHTRLILEKIAAVIGFVPNYIQVVGHTTADAADLSTKFTDSWELSTARANAARTQLVKAGIKNEQVARIVGKADRDPLNPENPADPANMRTTVTLLRKSVLSYHTQPAPEEVLMRPDDKKGIQTFIENQEKKRKRQEERDQQLDLEKEKLPQPEPGWEEKQLENEKGKKKKHDSGSKTKSKSSSSH